MENYSSSWETTTLMKMAVVSMEEPSGALPVRRRAGTETPVPASGFAMAAARRAARSPSPATPSGLQEEERQVLFEFIVVLKGDPLGIQRLPDKFTDFVTGDESASLHLWEAACGCCRWIVDVIFDARGKMYLHTGWEKFARYHHLEGDFVLMFSYLGDADMSVNVFDETRCRRHYHIDNTEEDDD
ncbi:hypothetical protein QYE76_047524 [Lolium multiflorum]|uniref:TF-B3 domain-containing protein n=1 Tax=Lolium multiflorum TaxID=4521 RepID=A0AAD8TQJ4_LOLMU|nr:hypothetical protein QYE76_047524 [Lolium multiflorum]